MNKVWSQAEEAQKLHDRFDRLKKDEGIGQAEFARRFEVPGGASMVSQHIKNRRPINLEAGHAYATGFGVALAEISPRLALEAAKSIEYVRPEKVGDNSSSNGLSLQEAPAPYRNEWLFPLWDEDKVRSLSPEDLERFQNAAIGAASVLNIDVVSKKSDQPSGRKAS